VSPRRLPAERHRRAAAAIVVLGAAVWPGGVASPSLERRIRRAAEVAHGNPELPVITSGGLGRHAPSEAEVMRRDLAALGVDVSRILAEDRSTSTLENARYSRDLLHARGISHVLVVTDRYHMLRALLTFRRLGFTAEGRPVRAPASVHPLRRAVRWGRELAALPLYLWHLR